MTVVAPRETRKERLSRLFDKAASIEARLSKLSLAAPTEDVDDEAFEGVQRPLVETTGRASVTVAKEEAPSLMLSTAQAAAIEQHSLTNMTTTTTMETHETAAPHSSTETTTSLDKKSSSHQETTAASKSFEVQKTKTTDYEPGLYMAASNRVTHKANELELLIGDLLQVTAILPDGWAFAMNLNTKDKGNVPLDCLERGVAASLEGSLSSTKLTKETRTVSDLHAKDAMDELNDSAKTVTLETTSAKTLVKQVHESEPNSAPLKEEIKKSVTSLDTRMVDGAASRESIHTLIDYENTPKLPQDLDMSPNLTFVMDDEQDQPLKEKYVVIRDRTPQKASELALFHGHVLLVTLIFSDGWCYAVDLSNGDSGICPIAFLTKTSAMDEYSSKMLLNNVTTKSLSGKKSPEYRTITTTTITVHRDEDDTPTQEAVNKRYRVIRSRLAQKASELTLSAGDYVLVSIIYSDGMVYGMNTATGESGLCHMSDLTSEESKSHSRTTSVASSRNSDKELYSSMKVEELERPILDTHAQSDVKTTKQIKTGVYRAVTDYAALNSAELNLTCGDVIKIDMVYNDDLCHGLNETTQLSGLCHSNHMMQDMTIQEDPRLGIYRVISSHIAERPNEINMITDDLVRVETIFTDGYCYAINIKTLETGICSMHFLEKINDAFLVGHATKLEALSKKRSTILHKHQTREIGVKEGGDLIEGLYVTTCARRALRPNHVNFEKGDYLMVAFLFSDGWCFGTHLVTGETGMCQLTDLSPVSDSDTLAILVRFGRTDLINSMEQKVDTIKRPMSPLLHKDLHQHEDYQVFKALEGHIATKASEMTFSEGDFILINVVFIDGTGNGVNIRTRDRGKCPMHKLQKVDRSLTDDVYNLKNEGEEERTCNISIEAKTIKVSKSTASVAPGMSENEIRTVKIQVKKATPPFLARAQETVAIIWAYVYGILTILFETSYLTVYHLSQGWYLKLDKKYHLSDISREDLFLKIGETLSQFFRILRKSAVVILAVQFFAFFSYSLVKFGFALYSKFSAMLPETTPVSRLYSWMSYLLFDVLEVGRFPVLLGNVLVVLALLGFFGELIIASLKEEGFRARRSGKESRPLLSIS